MGIMIISFLLLLIGGILISIYSIKVPPKNFIFILSGWIITAASIIPSIISGGNEAYKDSLQGNNPYKIEVRTEYRDGKFYDCDTVFVKIKKP